MKTSRSVSRDKETQRQLALIALRDAGIKRERRSGVLVSTLIAIVAGSVIAYVMYTYVFVPISLTVGSPVAAASNSMPGMYMGPTGGKNKPKVSPLPDVGASLRRLPGAPPDPSAMLGVMPGMYMSGQVPSGRDRARPLVPVLGTFGGGTAAVMLTAGFLRRRDRAAIEAKKAARVARRTTRS